MRIFENGKCVLATVLLWLGGSILIFQLGPSSKLMSWQDGIFFDMQPEFSDDNGLAAIGNLGREGQKLYRIHFEI